MKHSSPIDLTVEGNVIFSKLPQVLKAKLPIVSSPSLNFISETVDKSKAESPIFLTEEGISIFFKPTVSSKAAFGISLISLSAVKVTFSR